MWFGRGRPCESLPENAASQVRSTDRCDIAMERGRPPPQPQDILSQLDWVRSLAHALVFDSNEADDLAQETLLAALEAKRKPTGSLRAWLRKVLRNRLSVRMRTARRRSRRERVARNGRSMPSAEEALERAEIVRLLTLAVFKLKEPFRTAIFLRYFEALEPQEIAEVLGVPAATVRSRIRRGLAALRSVL